MAAPFRPATWNKELKEGGSTLFERKNARDDERIKEKAPTAELERTLGKLERTLGKLERTLGKVVVEKEFLVKKSVELGIDPKGTKPWL